MFIVRILFNALVMAAEMAAVAAIAWAGYSFPFYFAGATALLSLGLGAMLEAARLRNELPFYFGRASRLRALLVPVVGLVESFMKGVLAGLATLFTFAGTDASRLYWVAVVFALTVYAGASVLRVLSIKLEAYPARWGFFRLGAPLGLLFSAGIAIAAGLGLIQQASVSDIGWKLVWELPQKPSIGEVSELFFQIKQAFDTFIVTLLTAVFPPEWARLAGIVISVNVLAGFVAALYASVIAAVVRRVEQWGP